MGCSSSRRLLLMVAATVTVESIYHGTADHTLTNRTDAYVDVLMGVLATAHPTRTFVDDRIADMIDQIYHDIDAGTAPAALANFETPHHVFRDSSGHLAHVNGRYLAHNAMRQALGQPTGVDSTACAPCIGPIVRTYLDTVVEAHPPVQQPPVVSDTDGDGINDDADNCTLIPNDACDTDRDGYGNACDADCDNDEDGKIDFPADKQCKSADQISEQSPQL